MNNQKTIPVTLSEVFKYAERYGVDITVSYDSTFPGFYILTFSNKGSYRFTTTKRIDSVTPRFDDICRYMLRCGCEEINYGVINKFVEYDIRSKFENCEEEKNEHD